jgi:Peptidase A4 family
MTTNGNYSGVQASWDAPDPVSTTALTSADSTWVGIGGVTTSDLIQIGTQNFVEPSGQVITSAFYELLPSASIDITSLVVKPGDSISASIAETSPSQWSLSISDITDDQTFTTNLSYSSSNSSAEWIEEDPSYSFRRLIPFDNFQSVAFSNCLAVENSDSDNLSASGALPVTMVNNTGGIESSPSSVGTDGSSFTVTANPST